jgi:hypothetical protein
VDSSRLLALNTVNSAGDQVDVRVTVARVVNVVIPLDVDVRAGVVEVRNRRADAANYLGVLVLSTVSDDVA